MGMATENTRGQTRWGRSLVLALIGPMLAGCHVPQPPGKGIALHRVESETRRPYWLYLPQGYRDKAAPAEATRQYPVVVSLHGMRPFDDYGAHVRQWQQQADEHGFIVCAPRLRSCDVLMPFPVDNLKSRALDSDRRAVLAVLDELYQVTDADPDRVYVTSFSSGGYVAHYLLNRHPERFHALGVFQSNFTAKTLVASQVEKYRNHPIAIVTTGADFPLVQRETVQAISWYRAHGFPYVTVQTLESRGHERTPEPIGAFFAQLAASRVASIDEFELPTPIMPMAPPAVQKPARRRARLSGLFFLPPRPPMDRRLR